MRKNIIAIFLAVMMMAVFPVTEGFAAVMERRNFVAGGTYSVNLATAVSQENAEISGSSLSLDNGKASFEFLLPFYSNKVEITTDAKGSIDLIINDEVTTITLTGATVDYTFYTPIRMGEKNMTISTSDKVTISGITFKEIKEEECTKREAFDIDDYESDLLHSFIVREGSPIIKANTAVRYLDYDDLTVTPKYFDGTLYLPAKALSEALSCYYEEDKAKDFMVLRKSTTELVYLNGSFKTIIKDVEAPSNITKKEVNGVTYLPLRAVCELFDRYVLYKEGFVIVDYRSSAKAIADMYFDKIKAEFSEYMPQGIVGKTYYVSKASNASDSNDGLSKETAFATVTKAAEIAQAGDTVIIGAGEYREMLKPKNDGTATAPITFKAAEGEEVVFTGCDEVSGFEVYKNNILVAPAPWDMGLGKNQVFYNGKHLIEGRYPNHEFNENGLVDLDIGLEVDPVWITKGNLRAADKQVGLYITSDTLLQEEQLNYWQGAVFVSRQGWAWSLSAGIVKDSENGFANMKDVAEKWWYGEKAGHEANNYGYLTCHINTLDLPGEWTINGGQLFIIPPEGETKDTLKLLVKKRQLLFDLNDRKYIHIKGIKGFGGGARMGNSEMCVINDCDMSYFSHYSYFKDNRTLSIDGDAMNPNAAPQRGEVGIYVGGENNAVINSKLTFSAGSAVLLYGSYAYVSNNLMHDIAYGGSICGAIHMDTHQYEAQSKKRGGHLIVHNTVYNVHRNAISVSRSQGIDSNGKDWWKTSFAPAEVAYNEMYNSPICSNDTGILYYWGSDFQEGIARASVHNNYTYVIAENAEELIAPIYYDEWMAGVDTYDNIAWATRPQQYKHDIFESRKAEFSTFATVDSWNNVNLGVRDKGKDHLTVADFPSAKPFKVGSTLADYDFDLTYKSYTEKDKNVYKSESIVTTGDVLKTEDGYKFTGNDQVITIKDVDLTEKNMLNIMYTADYYRNIDKYKMVVGDINKPIGSTEVVFHPESKGLGEINTVHIDLSRLLLPKVVADIHFIPKEFGNARIVGVTVTENNASAYGDYKHTNEKVMAGLFGDSHWDNSVPENTAPTPTMKANKDPVFPIFVGAWGGNWTAYHNVEIKEDCTEFKIVLGSGGQWSDGTVSLRIGSPDAQPIVQLKTLDTGWALTEHTAKLTETLKAGTYELYLTFEGKGSCSDVHWFSLQ